MNAKIKNNSYAKYCLGMMIFFFFTSCAPKTYKALFYDYELVDRHKLYFVDRVYEATGNSFPRIEFASALHKKGSISARLLGCNQLANVVQCPQTRTCPAQG